jgi:hypothetical protein
MLVGQIFSVSQNIALKFPVDCRILDHRPIPAETGESYIDYNATDAELDQERSQAV